MLKPNIKKKKKLMWRDKAFYLIRIFVLCSYIINKFQRERRLSGVLYEFFIVRFHLQRTCSLLTWSQNCPLNGILKYNSTVIQFQLKITKGKFNKVKIFYNNFFIILCIRNRLVKQTKRHINKVNNHMIFILLSNRSTVVFLSFCILLKMVQKK